MSTPSVTTWLRLLRQGDPDAAEALFRQYFERLADVAHQHLSEVACRAGDGEDIALAALDSFFRGAREGRYPSLRDRHDLWRLLLAIALNKARKATRHEWAVRRGGGHVQAAVDLFDVLEDAGADLDRLASADPPPDAVVAFAEECSRLLSLLDDELRAVTQARLEGYTEREIAGRRGVAVRTVQRKLRLIRQIWSEPPAE